MLWLLVLLPLSSIAYAQTLYGGTSTGNIYSVSLPSFQATLAVANAAGDASMIAVRAKDGMGVSISEDENPTTCASFNVGNGNVVATNSVNAAEIDFINPVYDAAKDQFFFFNAGAGFSDVMSPCVIKPQTCNVTCSNNQVQGTVQNNQVWTFYPASRTVCGAFEPLPQDNSNFMGCINIDTLAVTVNTSFPNADFILLTGNPSSSPILMVFSDTDNGCVDSTSGTIAISSINPTTGSRRFLTQVSSPSYSICPFNSIAVATATTVYIATTLDGQQIGGFVGINLSSGSVTMAPITSSDFSQNLMSLVMGQ